MNGRATAHQAMIGVAFRSSDRPGVVIEFVIDTGFTGELTPPPAAVARLELPFARQITASLADDSTIFVNVHAATITWDGEERTVEAPATGARPLLGTPLLKGYELRVQFAEGGVVTVESL